MSTKSKAKYTPRQHQIAERIEENYQKRGYPKNRAWAIAWAVVRKNLRRKNGGSGS